MNLKKVKNNDDYYVDWYKSHNILSPFSNLSRIMLINDAKQENKMKSIENDTIPEGKISKVYGYKDKKWHHIGYSCLECGKPMKTETTIKKHPAICPGKRLNTE